MNSYSFSKRLTAIEKALKTLSALSHESGRNRKLDILYSAADNSALKRLIQLAADWRIKFGITCKAPTAQGDQHPISEKRYRRFTKLTEKLAAGELSGNAARSKLVELLDSCSGIEKYWYSRIINHKLEVGCSTKTFNAVWENLIPEFGVQLADTYEDFLERGEPLKFPLYVEPKLDGVRGTIIKTDGVMISRSRNGKDVTDSVSHLIKPFRNKKFSFIDGEWNAKWSKKDYHKYKGRRAKANSLLSTGRKKGGYSTTKKWKKFQKDNLYFTVFDKVSKDIFLQSKYFTDSTPFKVRRKKLEKFMAKISSPNVRLIKSYVVRSQKELDKLYKKLLKQGYEGLMIKFPNSPYATCRSGYWLKRKDFATEDYKIVSVNEGKGRLKGTLGSLTLLTPKGELMNAGTGWSDKKRRELWSKRKKLVGKYVEVRTQKEDGKATKSFPSFLIREDK